MATIDLSEYKFYRSMEKPQPGWVYLFATEPCDHCDALLLPSNHPLQVKFDNPFALESTHLEEYVDELPGEGYLHAPEDDGDESVTCYACYDKWQKSKTE